MASSFERVPQGFVLCNMFSNLSSRLYYLGEGAQLSLYVLSPVMFLVALSLSYNLSNLPSRTGILSFLDHLHRYDTLLLLALVVFHLHIGP